MRPIFERAVTQEILREKLEYHPDIGILSWRVGQRKGMVAGFRHPLGYIVVRTGKVNYMAHRLIWLMEYGQWPAMYVDHINGIKSDNRLINLREASYVENQQNSKPHVDNKWGQKGVCYCKNSKKFRVGAQLNGVKKFYGYFDHVEDAIERAKVVHAETSWGVRL